MLRRQVFQKYFRYIRILFVSRNYFRNWFSLGLKIFLSSKGFISIDNVKCICRDGTILDLPPKLCTLLLFGLFDGLFNVIKCNNEVVIARDFVIPFKELLASEAVLGALKHGWSYDVARGFWFKDDVKFKHMRSYIDEVFDYEEHRNVEVDGKVVVDVGAGYGETALYFLKRGARYVIAVEPCPEVYGEMLENFKLNGVEGKVAPINAALSSTRGSASIECPSGKVTVGTITLGDIIDRFSLRGGVLKMDCEGCEYDVILNDYEHVRLFDEVYFEYHAHITKIPVRVLLEKLSEDFKCEIVSNKEFYRRHDFSEKLLGLVRCVKKR
ncbi:MAG: FkbM family methyltransferase [Thermofilum sp.]|nr:FkbM family methyltransferase [Thermofilum sp.]